MDICLPDKSLQVKIGSFSFLIIIFFFVTCFSSPCAHSEEDKWTGEDKLLHLTVSFAIDTFSYNFYKKNTDLTDCQAKRTAFLTSLAFGFLKEFIDDRFSWKDIGADVLGAGIGAAMSIEF